jgi:hypothetical protein
MNPLEDYLRQLRDIHGSGAGVPETSYYPALSNLLNAVGATLKPKVRCIINPANRGAGIPDGGFYTSDQFPKSSHTDPLPGTKPARGVIEAKPVKDDAWLTAERKQVTKYWGTYRQVLVTNFRDFLLVGSDAEGNQIILDHYRLAANEKAFWSAAAKPQILAKEHAERFTEFLKRVMLHAAPLVTAKDLAWYLASYAREARARVESHKLDALDALRRALEETLGVKFEGDDGDHFFRSTLVQTLFYGVFSAWVVWSRDHSHADRKARFDWRVTQFYLRVPVLAVLFNQIASPGKLDELQLSEVLDWAGAALNRVDRASFFDGFQEQLAVQYFYEPFLEAYDPDLRKQLGVWYTPREIVQYMVARVDTVLREELNLADGLADRNVYVLDPCCGTGAYLVEVLKRIAETLKRKGGGALIPQEVKRAALERVFGFELLPAPFVIAHLQLGLTLREIGAPLSDKKKERAGIFLTNALTGWDPPTEAKKQVEFAYPEFKAERDAADDVKRDKPILVILGNPPYNAFDGVSPEQEGGLVETYKEGLVKEWGIKKFNLDDLYVRFFRLAERRIAEKTGRGVVAFISNFSYLGDPSFVVMRRRFTTNFDKLYFDSLNGDSRETGKLTPDGKPDPSVFSTENNKEGIRVGTAIATLVRRPSRLAQPTVLFRQFWGSSKRADLLASLDAPDFYSHYQSAKPEKSNRFSFRPTAVSKSYRSWPSLIDLVHRRPFAGLAEDRGKALISIDLPPLEARLRSYFDPRVDWDAIHALNTGISRDVPRFNAKKTRETLLKEEQFEATRLVRYAMRPFDVQWCYYSPVRPLWREPRPDYWQLYEDGSPTLVSRFKGDKSPEGPPVVLARHLSDYHCMPPNASIFPFCLRGVPRTTLRNQALPQTSTNPSAPSVLIPNLSSNARAYLSHLGIATGPTGIDAAVTLWTHILSVTYSTAFLSENADGIRQDFPRVPLPDSKELLSASANLGAQIAALLDTEKSVEGVTSGNIRPELRVIAVESHNGGKPLNPDAGDLDLTAGWGHLGKGAAVMPGSGKTVKRDYSPAERVAIETGAKALGLAPADAFRLLGDSTVDVFLNNVAFWRNIPVNVWGYTIGGYQVIKKWLSYREKKILGRALTLAEVYEVRDMARRIAAIILLGPNLDDNYRAVTANTYPFPLSAPTH